MFELEKAYDTLALVAANTQKIANTDIQKAEAQLHAVKRLVRPTDGTKPYYRTYWVADYNQAGEARHAIHSIDKVRKELEEKKAAMEKRPDDDWFKRQHGETKATHDRLTARIASLEAPGGAVKIEDKIPTKKPGVAGFQVKEERIKQIDAEVSEVAEQWKEWDKNGPDKIRKQTVADYKQAWKDTGLDIDDNSRHFSLSVKDSEGKELMTIGHDMSWGGREKRKPEFEMRMRHSSFKTSDPADFSKFAELTEAMAKVKSVTENPKMMERLGKLRSDYEDADMQGNYTNEFSDKIENLKKERRTLEEQAKAEKMVEALREIGSDSFEMKDPYRFGEGRRSSSYRYAKITKQTPKQVVVAFSDSAAEGSFYQTKTFPTEQFEKFAKEHIDLDAHLPDYTGEVKGTAVETAEHKDTAKKLGVKPAKLGNMINEDHKKEVAGKAGSIADNKANKPEPKTTTSIAQAAYQKKKEAESTAPEKHTMDTENNKKVVGFDKYVHPTYGEYNKGDQVVFEHKGEMKGGKVIRVNVYQRFPNPYVVMEGSDGKRYELVISKVNVYKDGEAGKVAQTKGGIKFEGVLSPLVWEKVKKEIEVGFGSLDDLDEHPDEITPKEFNNGFCQYFAQALNKIDSSFVIKRGSDFKEAERLTRNYHEFVTKDGKFYDAESPEGVNKVTDLKFYKRFQ